MSATKALNDAKLVFLALLTIGLIGILFLIVYGNLSGNLGWASEGIIITNETGVYVNITGYTLDGTSDIGAASYVITEVWVNVSNNDFIIPAANYTVSTAGVLTNNTIITDSVAYDDATVSYTYNRDSESDKRSEAVIGNLSTGATSFFSFSNVWFILLAVTVLIGIVLGVISIVGRIGGEGGKGRSEFTS